MSLNIRDRETSYCLKSSPYQPYNFLNDNFWRSTRYLSLSSLLESRWKIKDFGMTVLARE